MSQEFIIVVKAPKNRLSARIVSFIDITMADDTFNDKHEKQVSNGGIALRQTVRKMDVLLLGYLDNPKVRCMKQLFNKQANAEVVSLAVKKTQGVQKFKLPFKNLSNYLDSDIEFAFIRTQATHQPQPSGSSSLLKDPIECLQFYC